MNPYYMLGLITVSIVLYASLVALVSLTGLPVVGAMVLVYAVMLYFMFSMQKRARQAYVPNERRRNVAFAHRNVRVVQLGFAGQEAANQDGAGVPAAASDRY